MGYRKLQFVFTVSLLLALTAPARAETLTRSCKYESRAFRGTSVGVLVDFNGRTIIFGDQRRQSAEITQRFISSSPSDSAMGVRIDRITGVVSFSYFVNGRATA